MWSTREDPRFDQSFWGKSLNLYFWKFWLNLVKYEFDLCLSLGFLQFGASQRFPKLWVAFGWTFGEFVQTLIYGDLV
jgi:hypothetical protein